MDSLEKACPKGEKWGSRGQERVSCLVFRQMSSVCCFCCRLFVYFYVAAHRLLIVEPWALEPKASGVAACGMSVPQSGILYTVF